MCYFPWTLFLEIYSFSPETDSPRLIFDCLLESALFKTFKLTPHFCPIISCSTFTPPISVHPSIHPFIPFSSPERLVPVFPSSVSFVIQNPQTVNKSLINFYYVTKSSRIIICEDYCTVCSLMCLRKYLSQINYEMIL